MNRRAVMDEIQYSISNATRSEFAIRFPVYVWTDLLELVSETDTRDRAHDAATAELKKLRAELESTRRELASAQELVQSWTDAEQADRERASVVACAAVLRAGADPIEVAERHGWESAATMVDAIIKAGAHRVGGGR